MDTMTKLIPLYLFVFLLIGCVQSDTDQPVNKVQGNHYITINQEDDLQVEFLQITEADNEDGFFVEMLLTHLSIKPFTEEEIRFYPINTIMDNNKIQYNSKYYHIEETSEDHKVIHKELFQPQTISQSDFFEFSYTISKPLNINYVAFVGASPEDSTIVDTYFTAENIKITDNRLQFVLNPNNNISNLQDNLSVVLMIDNEEVYPLFSRTKKAEPPINNINFDLTFAFDLPEKFDFRVKFQQTPVIVSTLPFNVPSLEEELN